MLENVREFAVLPLRIPTVLVIVRSEIRFHADSPISELFAPVGNRPAVIARLAAQPAQHRETGGRVRPAENVDGQEQAAHQRQTDGGPEKEFSADHVPSVVSRYPRSWRFWLGCCCPASYACRNN